MRLRPIRAVVFDLDGTLINTIQGLADSLNGVLERRGLPVHPVDSFKVMVGEGMENLVWKALPEAHRGSETIQSVCREMSAEYDRQWQRTTTPYEGIPEMLAALAAKGLPLAVLSNKPDEFTRVMVAHYFPEVPFRIVRGALPGVPKKPAPDGAIRIAGEFGIPVDEVMYIGDTNTDMDTGVGAGMFTVGVLWGFRSAQELADHGARVLVARAEELVRLVG